MGITVYYFSSCFEVGGPHYYPCLVWNLLCRSGWPLTPCWDFRHAPSLPVSFFSPDKSGSKHCSNVDACSSSLLWPYLVSTNDVWEAAEEAFVLVVALHQEVEVLLWLQQDTGWLLLVEELRKSKRRNEWGVCSHTLSVRYRVADCCCFT